MINVLIPITENVQVFNQFIEQCSQPGITFYVGIKQGLKEQFSVNKKNVKVFVYSNNSQREEIINSLHTQKMKKGKILIARRPLSNEEFSKLESSPKDIAVLCKHHNRFVKWMKIFLMKIIKTVFAFSYFEDISASIFDQSLFELLSVCDNFSMTSRINKFVGVEIEEIETSTKSAKKTFCAWKTYLLFSLLTLFFLGSITGGILIFCFVKSLAPLYVVLIVFWIILALMLEIAEIVNFARTLSVGQLRYGRAEEIK